MTHTPTGSLHRIAKRLQCLRNRNPRIHLPLDDSIVRADEYRYFTEFRSRHATARLRNEVPTLNIGLGKTTFRANLAVLRFDGMPAARTLDFS